MELYLWFVGGHEKPNFVKHKTDGSEKYQFRSMSII
jgi:hypothetical protein